MEPRIRQLSRQGGRPDSNVIWFAEECLNNGVRLDGHLRAAEQAGDRQLADFFRRALVETRNIPAGDPRLGRLRHEARRTEFGLR